MRKLSKTLSATGAATIVAAAVPAGAAKALFQTTFDGATAISSPAVGNGSGAQIVTAPANDFVAAANALGLRCDAAGERAYIPQANGPTQNVELDHGTITFFYKPNHDPGVDIKTSIVGTGLWGTPGTVHFGKHSSANQNGLYLQVFEASGQIGENYVAPKDYSWTAGQWLHVRITWDFTVPAAEQNVHLYLNGAEIALTKKSTGPTVAAAESSSNFIYVGARGPGGSIVPAGIYDDLTIWDDVVPPQASGGTGGSSSSGGNGGASGGAAGASGGAAGASAGAGGGAGAAIDADAGIAGAGGYPGAGGASGLGGSTNGTGASGGGKAVDAGMDKPNANGAEPESGCTMAGSGGPSHLFWVFFALGLIRFGRRR